MISRSCLFTDYFFFGKTSGFSGFHGNEGEMVTQSQPVLINYIVSCCVTD